MNDADDRLAGDLVWELFPVQPAEKRSTRFLHVLEVAFLVALTWFLSQPLSVAIACLAVSLKDFRDGRRLAGSMPDKAGGTICALFAYSWGAFKIGAAAFASMFVTVMIAVFQGIHGEMPPGAATAMLLWSAGFSVSSILSVAGMIKALRSGMRVWIGEGVNQARTLLLGMLITGFAFSVLVPMCIWLVKVVPREDDSKAGLALFMLGLLACMFVAPVVILFVLDRVSRRVLADQPGKFGPKVPAVGKWQK